MLPDIDSNILVKYLRAPIKTLVTVIGEEEISVCNGNTSIKTLKQLIKQNNEILKLILMEHCNGLPLRDQGVAQTQALRTNSTVRYV